MNNRPLCRSVFALSCETWGGGRVRASLLSCGTLAGQGTHPHRPRRRAGSSEQTGPCDSCGRGGSRSLCKDLRVPSGRTSWDSCGVVLGLRGCSGVCGLRQESKWPPQKPFALLGCWRRLVAGLWEPLADLFWVLCLPNHTVRIIYYLPLIHLRERAVFYVLK